MHKTIENIIKKNLPEKVGYLIPDILKDVDIDKALPSAIGARAFNQAISQIDTSLVADEVLKVVVENYKLEFEKLNFLTFGLNNKLYIQKNKVLQLLNNLK